MSIHKDLEKHKLIYQLVFNTQDGKYILEDLKSTLCVNSDLITDNDSYKEGLRLAYRYIENHLSTTNK
jgi:hypothetical protein